MINKLGALSFCKDPIEWIENYKEAVNDTTQTWVCHHRNEIKLGYSMEELIEKHLYYQVSASDLIFLKRKDHTILHNINRSDKTKQKHKNTIAQNGGMIGDKNPNYGNHHSEETKKKISTANKGRLIGDKNPNYNKHLSLETRQKLSEANIKYNIPEEELYNLYVVQGLSTYKIAEMYGCNPECIRHKLKKFNISKSRS